MAKSLIDYPKLMEPTTRILGSYGALLVANDRQGKPNVMTIGWAAYGIIWSKPMMLVLVRPSRHTYQFMEQSDSFTVNLPPPEMAAVATYCGTVSGRDVDKFAAKGLTAVKGNRVSASFIEQCPAHYECRIVHKNHVVPQVLDPGIVSGCYPKGDFHTIYYGEIIACYAEESFR